MSVACIVGDAEFTLIFEVIITGRQPQAEVVGQRNTGRQIVVNIACVEQIVLVFTVHSVCHARGKHTVAELTVDFAEIDVGLLIRVGIENVAHIVTETFKFPGETCIQIQLICGGVRAEINRGCPASDVQTGVVSIINTALNRCGTIGLGYATEDVVADNADICCGFCRRNGRNSNGSDDTGAQQGNHHSKGLLFHWTTLRVTVWKHSPKAQQRLCQH